MREEPLTGGRNAREVVRVGDTVRRAAEPGSAFAAGRECVVHGDPGPFNAIFHDGTPVAFIDWMSCRPGDRLEDRGSMAWTWCIQSLGGVPIDEQAAHLRELRDGYGPVRAETLISAMIRSQDRVVAGACHQVARGRQIFLAWTVAAHPDVQWKRETAQEEKP